MYYPRITISIAVMLLIPSVYARKTKEHAATTRSTKSEASMGLATLPPEFDSVLERRKEHAQTRFSKIKVPDKVALNEIEFWSHQLSEHALFLHLGLEEQSLKNRGNHLHNKFEAFRKKL